MSGPRATVYAFGAAVLAIVMFYVDAEVQEIVLWQAGLAAAVPFGALVLATVKAWPRKPKGSDDV